MSDLTLYNIASDYKHFKQLIDECSADEMEMMAECLSSIQGPLEEKVINIGKLIKNFEYNAEAIKDAAKQLNLKAKRVEAKVECLKAYVRDNLIACDLKMVVTPEITVSLRKSSGRLIVDDEAKIPPEYLNHKEVVSVDKLRLKADLLEDHLIDGCHIDFTPTLQVK